MIQNSTTRLSFIFVVVTTCLLVGYVTVISSDTEKFKVIFHLFEMLATGLLGFFIAKSTQEGSDRKEAGLPDTLNNNTTVTTQTQKTQEIKQTEPTD